LGGRRAHLLTTGLVKEYISGLSDAEYIPSKLWR
jgi:hypothetical protein